MAMELVDLKANWNEVLDYLLDADRIAWLAFFDARLVSFEAGTLTLSFIDPAKMSGGHDFSISRNPKHIALLKEAISSELGLDLEIVEL